MLFTINLNKCNVEAEVHGLYDKAIDIGLVFNFFELELHGYLLRVLSYARNYAACLKLVF